MLYDDETIEIHIEKITEKMELLILSTLEYALERIIGKDQVGYKSSLFEHDDDMKF